MAGFNRVIIMGNITRDLELRHTPQGTAVTEMSVAVNTPHGKGADRKDDTCFVDVTVWDKQAENCCEYLGKGSGVLVEGRLRQDTWEDKDTGKKRSKLAVTAQNVQFLGSPDGNQQRQPRQSSNNTRRNSDPKEPKSYGDIGNDFGSGDVPF